MKTKNNIIIFIYLFILILLSIIFYIIMKSNLHNNIISFDYKIFNMFSKISNKNLTIFFRTITEFGNIFIPVTILLLLIVFIKKKYIIIIQSLSYGLSGIVSLITKYIYLRERPTIALIKIPKTYSFPSGHTLTSFVFYIMICYLLTRNKSKNTKIICYTISLLLIILIAISRVYLKVHYFSDVIGGLIYGIVVFLLLKNLINKYFKEKNI